MSLHHSMVFLYTALTWKKHISKSVLFVKETDQTGVLILCDLCLISSNHWSPPFSPFGQFSMISNKKLLRKFTQKNPLKRLKNHAIKNHRCGAIDLHYQPTRLRAHRICFGGEKKTWGMIIVIPSHQRFTYKVILLCFHETTKKTQKTMISSSYLSIHPYSWLRLSCLNLHLPFIYRDGIHLCRWRKSIQHHPGQAWDRGWDGWFGYRRSKIWVDLLWLIHISYI